MQLFINSSLLILSTIFALYWGPSVGTEDFELRPLKNGGKHWALIVAGSNTYMNYRHQADACHAYHVMKDHGVPEENIILMMYDDIAYNRENPDKGVIINRPNGENVYTGVKIDYKGKEVTPKIFLSVLQGEEFKVRGKGSGRVIKSGPNDHVFVNFVDHGAPGLVAFPEDELHARTFMKALKSMHTEKKYAQMVIYIESCESGSMFKNLLPDNINIYATTAANAKESSYATYYDKHLRTYLGDLYSVKWMENSDVANLNKETLESQYTLVKRETNMSHVQQYGDRDMSTEPVGDFQGSTPSARNVYYPKLPFDAVPSPDVELHVLHHQLADAETEDEHQSLITQLEQKLEYRDGVTQQMKHIVSVALNHAHSLVTDAMSIRTEEINFDCYEPAVMYYSEHCRKISTEPFTMRVLYMIQNACNVDGMQAKTLISAMSKVCKSQ